MVQHEELVERLRAGPLHQFADWPCKTLPLAAAGIYTIWDEASRLVYVGMSGRIGSEKLLEATTSGKQKGLAQRLDSHASGRRSGDQFCIYVFDRMVLPTVDRAVILAVAAGNKALNHMDVLTRNFIRERLSFRFVVVDTPEIARAIESRIKARGFDGTPPLLNPLLPVGR